MTMALLAAEPIPAPKLDIRHLDVNTVGVSPARFQFKGNVNPETGAGTKLAGGIKYDPLLGGVLYAWEDLSGKVWIVNGHHRLDLARRSGYPTISAIVDREADGVTEADARSRGALINIAEGQGTPIDVAKFLRDSGQSVEWLRSRDIAPANKLVERGAALAQLDDGLFYKVITGQLAEDAGVVIGAGLPGDHANQRAVANLVSGTKKELTPRELKALIQEAKGQTVKVQQINLFGETTEEKSTMIARAKVRAWIEDELAQDKKLFRFVTKAGRPEQLARGETVVNIEKGQELARQSGTALEIFNAKVNAVGPINDIVRDAAEEVVKGGNERTARENALRQIRDAISTGVALGDGSGTNRVGAEGSPSGVGAEAPAPASEPVEEAESKTIPIHPRDIRVGDRYFTTEYGYLTVEKVFPFNEQFPASQQIETNRGRRDIGGVDRILYVERRVSSASAGEPATVAPPPEAPEEPSEIGVRSEPTTTEVLKRQPWNMGGGIDYAAMKQEFPRLKAALTRATKKGPEAVRVEVARAKARFEEIGYPDDWARWERAQEDAEWASRQERISLTEIRGGTRWKGDEAEPSAGPIVQAGFGGDMGPGQVARGDAERAPMAQAPLTEIAVSEGDRIAQARQGEKYPDGRTIPQVGDKVVSVSGGFGGGAQFNEGVVKKNRRGELVVRISHITGFIGGKTPVKHRPFPLTPSWTKEGEETPYARSRREAEEQSKRWEQEAREDTANRERDTAAIVARSIAAGDTPYMEANVKPGMIVRVAFPPSDTELGIVTEVEHFKTGPETFIFTASDLERMQFTDDTLPEQITATREIGAQLKAGKFPSLELITKADLKGGGGISAEALTVPSVPEHVPTHPVRSVDLKVGERFQEGDKWLTVTTVRPVDPRFPDRYSVVTDDGVRELGQNKIVRVRSDPAAEGKPVPREALAEYPDITLATVETSKQREARIFKETEAKFAEEAASTETISEREARRAAERRLTELHSPQSIAASFARAGQEVAERDAAMRALAAKLPDGTVISGWKKGTVPDGPVFWERGRRNSLDIHKEVGGRKLVKALGLPEDANVNPKDYVNVAIANSRPTPMAVTVTGPRLPLNAREIESVGKSARLSEEVAARLELFKAAERDFRVGRRVIEPRRKIRLD